MSLKVDEEECGGVSGGFAGTVRADVSRRNFILGGTALLGFAAGRMFAAPPGWTPPNSPNLVFGVLSDTHLRTRHGSSGRPGRNWPNRHFAAALGYFRSQNVDAVMHCGDWAHRGQVEEMRFHADVWRRVFPKNLAPDGHKVEKLFVTGNHDTEGAAYGGFVAKNYPDPAVRAKHVMQSDMAGNWKRIWGEEYEPAWHREVKGYHFFGRNHGVPLAKAAECLGKHAAVLAESRRRGRPFFFMQHSRPLWDMRKKLRHLCRGASPVAFFGHNHWSSASWNVISLYRGGVPCIQVPSCEPRGCGALVGDAWITKAKIERTDRNGKGRLGYVVRLYDDMMVISRREFGQGGSMGSDWIMPLGRRSPHPLSKGELKKIIGVPQFRADARITAAVESRGGGLVKLSIPLADGNPASRVYAYEVLVEALPGSNGLEAARAFRLYKAVYAAGCNLGIGHEPCGGVTELQVPAAELPARAALTFTVTPLTSLGTRGRPLSVVLPSGRG
jgi:predicted phosphodiesterase